VCVERSGHGTRNSTPPPVPSPLGYDGPVWCWQEGNMKLDVRKLSVWRTKSVSLGHHHRNVAWQDDPKWNVEHVQCDSDTNGLLWARVSHWEWNLTFWSLQVIKKLLESNLLAASESGTYFFHKSPSYEFTSFRIFKTLFSSSQSDWRWFTLIHYDEFSLLPVFFPSRSIYGVLSFPF
jgi:hypothetical protein